MIKKFPDMEHDTPGIAHVAPGKTGEIVWAFSRPGVFDFACPVTGHVEAGMVGKIKVVPADARHRAIRLLTTTDVVFHKRRIS